MSKPIPWSPKRSLNHWQENSPFIFHYGLRLPFYRNWSQCEYIKTKTDQPTFLKELIKPKPENGIFHCWECVIAIISLRLFVFPFIKKEKHHMGYYKGFWDNIEAKNFRKTSYDLS